MEFPDAVKMWVMKKHLPALQHLRNYPSGEAGKVARKVLAKVLLNIGHPALVEVRVNARFPSEQDIEAAVLTCVEQLDAMKVKCPNAAYGEVNPMDLLMEKALEIAEYGSVPDLTDIRAEFEKCFPAADGRKS